MMIKDLSVSKEVEMTAVRGGALSNAGNLNIAASSPFGVSVVTAPVVQVDPFGGLLGGSATNTGNVNAALAGSFGASTVTAPVIQIL